MSHYLWSHLRISIPFLLALLLAIGLACGEAESPTDTPAAEATAAPAQPGATAVPTAAPAATSPPAAPPDSRAGGIIPMLAHSNPLTFDPHQGANSSDVGSFSPLYSQLVEYNPINPSEIIGDLAESWEFSGDGLALTFVLRDGIKWSDGVDFTADDIVFSINRMAEPEEPRPRAGRVRFYVDSVEAVDERTARVNQLFSSPVLLKLLAVDYMKILPRHVVEAGADLRVFDNVVGTGPFRGVSFTSGVSYEYERNPDYFKDGVPYFDGIKASIMNDKGTIIANFKTERILMHNIWANHLDIDDLVQLEADEEFMSKFDIIYKEAGGDHVLMNTTKAPYNDERVRRAIFLAIDRQELVDGFGLGKYWLGRIMARSNPFAFPEEELAELPGYRQLDGKKHPDDLAEAKRLMAEAGYADGFDAIMTVPTIEYFPDATQVIKEQLKNALNLNIEVRTQEFTGWVTAMNSADFDLAWLGYGMMVIDPDDRLQALYLEGSRNWTRWHDPVVDELFAEQQQELDFDRRKELNYEIQERILTGAPGTVEVIWRPLGIIVSKRIKTEAGGYVVSETIQTVMKREHEWLESE